MAEKEIKIGTVTYLVTPIFKENSDMTVVNKISRLIKADAEKSVNG